MATKDTLPNSAECRISAPRESICEASSGFVESFNSKHVFALPYRHFRSATWICLRPRATSEAERHLDRDVLRQDKAKEAGRVLLSGEIGK